MLICCHEYVNFDGERKNIEDYSLVRLLNADFQSQLIFLQSFKAGWNEYNCFFLRLIMIRFPQNNGI